MQASTQEMEVLQEQGRQIVGLREGIEEARRELQKLRKELGKLGKTADIEANEQKQEPSISAQPWLEGMQHKLFKALEDFAASDAKSLPQFPGFALPVQVRGHAFYHLSESKKLRRTSIRRAASESTSESEGDAIELSDEETRAPE